MSKNEKNKSARCMADKKCFGILVVILWCLLLADLARGAAWLEKAKIAAAGWSVSISGDYVIVGAPGWASGAYIFRRDGTEWVQQQKLTASDGADGDSFGFSVSISGDYVIVGAYGDDDKGIDSGSAYIFRWDGTSWVQQQKLTASDGASWDMFGRSVSISGDYAIVGAFGDDSERGSAYIFRRDGTGWVQQQKLTASDRAALDGFGGLVSISGDYAIVGASYNDDKGSDTGSAYIFKRDGTSWVQQQKLLASDGAAEDYFGLSVSISGDYAIVGAIGDDDKGDFSGSACIFKRDGASWLQQPKLLAADGAAGDWFGYSVSISGDLAIVGAIDDDDKGDFSGSAYIFRWDGTSWVQQQKLTASDGASWDMFGRSVFISGADAIVGSEGGSAYVFMKCPTADLSGDCCVNFYDFAVIGNQWLQAPGYPPADIAPEGGDGVVNFLDLDVLVNEWLQCD